MHILSLGTTEFQGCGFCRSLFLFLKINLNHFGARGSAFRDPAFRCRWKTKSGSVGDFAQQCGIIDEYSAWEGKFRSNYLQELFNGIR